MQKQDSRGYGSTCSLESWDEGVQKPSSTLHLVDPAASTDTWRRSSRQSTSGSKRKISFFRRFSTRKSSSPSTATGGHEAGLAGAGGINFDFVESTPTQTTVRVFCEGIKTATEYEDVDIHQQTSAGQVVDQVLGRMQVPVQERGWYALFDVVGRLEEDEEVNELETPAATGTLPPPAPPPVQRFLEQGAHRISPEELLLQMLLFWEPQDDIVRRLEVRPAHPILPEDEELEARRRATAALPHVELECQTDPLSNGTAPVAPLGPFLLLLKGFDHLQDRVHYELGQENRVGSATDSQVQLFHPGCPAHVCSIDVDYENVSGDAAYNMAVRCVAQDTVVTINGEVISGTVVLLPGDLLAVDTDQQYLFLFKDSAQVSEKSLRLPQFREVRDPLARRMSGASSSDTDGLKESLSASSSRNSVKPPLASLERYLRGANSAAAQQNSTASPEVLRELSAEILRLQSGDEIPCRVGSVLLVLLMEYCNSHYGVAAVASLQNSLSVVLTELSHKLAEASNGVRFQPLARLAMTCFEVRSYYHQVAVAVAPTSTSVHWLESSEFFQNRTEIMLRDILNCIIDKSNIVSSSRALLLEDPFRNDPSTAIDEESMSMQSFLVQLERIVKAFRSVSAGCAEHVTLHGMMLLLVTLSKCLVLHIITDNELLRWFCGVRMRSNLDRLIEWLDSQQLKDLESTTELLAGVVDLLATPKRKLTSMSWQDIRNLFPMLPPSLLNHVLQFYENGNGFQTRIWRPPQDEVTEWTYSASKAVDDHYHDVLKAKHVFSDYERPSQDIRLIMKEPVFNAATQKLALYMRRRSYPQDVKVLLQNALSYLTAQQGPAITVTLTRDVEEEAVSSSGGSTSGASTSHHSKPPPMKQPPPMPKLHMQSAKYLNPIVNSKGRSSSSSHLNRVVDEPSAMQATYRPILSYQPVQASRRLAAGPSNNMTNYSSQLAELSRLSKSIQDLQRNQLSGVAAVSLEVLNFPPTQQINRHDDFRRLIVNRGFANPGLNAPPMATSSSTNTINRRLAKSTDLSNTNKLPQKAPSFRQEVPVYTTVPSEQQNMLPLELERKEDTSEIQMPEDLRVSSDSSQKGAVDEKTLDSNDSPWEDHRRHTVTEDRSSPVVELRQTRRQAEPIESDYFSSVFIEDYESSDPSYVEVVLRRENGSLGLGLCDGMEVTLQRPGVFIRTVVPNGPAFKNGFLAVGDEVVSVNGHDLRSGMSHAETINLIKNAGSVLRMKVKKADEATKLHFLM